MSEAWDRLCAVARTEAWKAALPVLAGNLAMAGALCAAFDLGLYNRECANVFPSVDWTPGCGRSAP